MYPHPTCAILCPCSYDYDNYYQPGVVTMNKSSILLAGKYSDEFNSGWTHGHNKVKELHNIFEVIIINLQNCQKWKNSD